MNIDYNDQRFQQVNNEKQTRLNEVNNTYNNMINQSEQYYNNLAKEAERYGNQQQQLQQQRTDFAIDKIEQQKDWAKQDYTKEQKGAYQDYAKQTNNYGVNAEQMAQSGLLGTGYAESSRVAMYNAYQNRVATARESYNRAVIDYDMAIKDAQLSNNSVLAELAHNTLQTKLELALQGFQYKNDLIKTRLNAVNETEDRYYSRWNDVLQQINKEKAFEYQKERDRIADEQYAQSLAARYSSGGGYPEGLINGSGLDEQGGSWLSREANRAMNVVNNSPSSKQLSSNASKILNAAQGAKTQSMKNGLITTAYKLGQISKNEADYLYSVVQ